MVKTSEAQIVYDAEHEVEFILENDGSTYDFYGSTIIVPVERRFARIQDVQTYVNKVCEWLDLGTPPKVRPRRGNRKATYKLGVIAVPPHEPGDFSWAMREIVVLHELAHHLTNGHGHDEVFCGKMVWLLNKCIAPEAGLLFTAALDERGVKVKL